MTDYRRPYLKEQHELDRLRLRMEDRERLRTQQCVAIAVCTIAGVVFVVAIALVAWHYLGG